MRPAWWTEGVVDALCRAERLELVRHELALVVGVDLSNPRSGQHASIFVDGGVHRGVEGRLAVGSKRRKDTSDKLPQQPNPPHGLIAMI